MAALAADDSRLRRLAEGADRSFQFDGGFASEAPQIVEVARELVVDYGGGAPESVQVEAVRRLASWLVTVNPSIGQSTLSAPDGSSITTMYRMAASSGLRASGAQALLSPWTQQRAAPVGDTP